MDERINKIAQNIVYNAIDVKKNERVLIMVNSLECRDLVLEVIKLISAKEGLAFVKIVDPQIAALLELDLSEERIRVLKEIMESELKLYDSFISIRYSQNDYEFKDSNQQLVASLAKETEEIANERINNRKWVLLNYPSSLDAFKAMIPTKKFYDYAMDVLSVDYSKYKTDVIPLVQLMEKTKKVTITAPATNLTFSIEGMPIIPCCGEKNIPDGEVYVAPIKTSSNGYITFNCPSPYHGYVFNNIKLTLKDGKIIEATSDNYSDKLNEILDTDEGSRYIGEFAIGFNKSINHPMGDILFDEKINGSIHYTPGRAYLDSFNGNTSAIHWDMVLIQTANYGGGNIYFDDVLIRENGKFVVPELKHLN